MNFNFRAGSLLMVCLLSGFAGAQTRTEFVEATATQQQAAEITAATALAPELAKKWPMAETAFDPRLYKAFYDGIFTVSAKDPESLKSSSALSTSHTEQHVSELTRILGIPAVVDDSRSCVNDDPLPCRLGPYKAFFFFSPAFIRGDSVQIAMKIAGLPHVRGGSAFVPVAVITVTMVSEKAGLRVARIERAAIN